MSTLPKRSKYDEKSAQLPGYWRRSLQLTGPSTSTDSNETENRRRSVVVSSASRYREGFPLYWQHDFDVGSLGFPLAVFSPVLHPTGEPVSATLASLTTPTASSRPSPAHSTTSSRAVSPEGPIRKHRHGSRLLHHARDALVRSWHEDVDSGFSDYHHAKVSRCVSTLSNDSDNSGRSSPKFGRFTRNSRIQKSLTSDQLSSYSQGTMDSSSNSGIMCRSLSNIEEKPESHSPTPVLHRRGFLLNFLRLDR
uniref:DUF4005 domain-containing protein n=1 Tax=Panagrellus redivivus TaxID=6233 RepID=A0A7E4UVK5_PANRE